jgi:type I restriction enzyme S subunit
MKLKKDTWTSIQIGNIVSELRNSSNNPVKDGYYGYVGFEHIESENIHLKQFGDLNDGVSFKKTFQKNDVLFGKIRAYLKKVAVAPIDGICSGDILVLRTKDEKILSQELLAYFLTTESFLKRAVDSSIGTTLPRTKWQYLSKHEILLPPLEEQKQIATLFQSIETAMEQVDGQEKNLKALWQKLIDEFVTEAPLFGILLNGKKTADLKFADVTEKIARRIDPFEKGIKRRIGGENFISSDLKLRSWGNVEKDYVGPSFHMHVLPGDILYVSRNSHLRKVAYADFEGVCSNTTYVVQSNEKYVIQNLMKHIMLSEGFTKYAMSVTKGSTNPYLNWKDLDSFSFKVPDIATQREIANVLDGILQNVEQLKQQKSTLKNLKQKLLNEILG